MSAVKQIFLIGALMSVGACTNSSVSGNFTCSAPEGLGCVSMTEADNHTRGMHTHGDYAPAMNAIVKGAPQKNVDYAGAWTGPKRAPEQVWRIWFPSFVDKAGNYHADSAIYVALPAAAWIEQEVVD